MNVNKLKGRIKYFEIVSNFSEEFGNLLEKYGFSFVVNDKGEISIIYNRDRDYVLTYKSGTPIINPDFVKMIGARAEIKKRILDAFGEEENEDIDDIESFLGSGLDTQAEIKYFVNFCDGEGKEEKKILLDRTEEYFKLFKEHIDLVKELADEYSWDENKLKLLKDFEENMYSSKESLEKLYPNLLLY